MIVAYLVTLYNKAPYITEVIRSLIKTEGDFQKRYIIINDGSNDNSLDLVRKITSDLKNVLIINQANMGPSKSTNIGIKAAKGANYIQFVDGDDMVSTDSTALLLKGAQQFNCSVAFAMRGFYRGSDILDQKKSLPLFNLIQDPLKHLLAGKIGCIRRIGSSGSLVAMPLLKKIKGCDEKVFVQDFSLALRCAKFSNFVRINKNLAYSPIKYDNTHLSYDKNFEHFQSIMAAGSFLESNLDLNEKYLVCFYKYFYSFIWRNDKSFLNFLKYIKSKMSFNIDISIKDLIELYKNQIEKY